jgi:predicted ATPase
LMVGRNNVGKSNFLKAFQAHAENCKDWMNTKLEVDSHYQTRTGIEPTPVTLELAWSNEHRVRTSSEIHEHDAESYNAIFPEIYSLDPAKIGGTEPAETTTGVIPRVFSDGKGVTSVLRMLMQGNAAMRQRFQTIERQWRQCVPEIKTLHLPPTGPVFLMVEQQGIPDSLPLSDLSDGARLILGILTIIHQETPPPLILLEDLDHRIHARLFSSLVSFMRDQTSSGAISQIIATTHNPYLVDEFLETPEAVVIVEKTEGRSTLVNMDERLARFLEKGESLDLPLGQVLFSGLADAPPPASLLVVKPKAA